MVAARGLVIVEVVLDKEGSVFGQGIDNAAGERIAAVFLILHPLGVQRLFFGIARIGGILRVKIAFRVYTAHVVHGRG